MGRPADIFESQNEKGLRASVGREAGERLGYLDALRGIAILGVIGLHASLIGSPFKGAGFMKLGEYGVQLFFVISGFTIMLVYRARSKWVDRPNRDFFIRRFFRLAPMFWVGVLLYAWLPGRELTTPGIVVSWPHYLATVLFLHGWHRETLNSVVPGGWSIAVEATFYLCVPVIAKFVRGAISAAWFFVVAVVFGQVANIAAHLLLGWHSDPNYALDTLYLARWFPGQACYFALGVLLYEICLGESPVSAHRGAGCIALAVGGLLFLGLLHLDSSFRFIEGRLTSSISIGLIFIGVVWSSPRVLVNPFTRLLGRLSYSCYILHFVVLEYVQAFVQGRIQNPYIVFGLSVVGTLGITILLSAVTFELIENPAIRAAHVLTKRVAAHDERIA